MIIAVASNHIGFKAKAGVISLIKQLGHDAIDFGPSSDDLCDYPDFAVPVALAVTSGQAARGILLGGTGIGFSIVANKFDGIRAALCHDDISAEISRRQNDANVLCLSVDLLGENVASRMIEVWLTAEFENRQHARRIAKIAELESEIRSQRLVSQF